MKRFAFLVQFNGKNFSGSQRQANAPSVQAELEAAMTIFFRENISVCLSSRIDARVHARGMVGHINIKDENNSRINNDEFKICAHLNGILPTDISVLGFRPIPTSLNTRRDAISRTYEYKLRASKLRYSLDGDTVAHYKCKLNLDRLNEISSKLLGKHDCTGLSRPYEYKTSSVCNITESFWREEDEDLYTFRITADHFLYKMVRNIVGTQIDMQNAKLSVYSLENSLKLKDRRYLGHTAKPEGLCLECVNYLEPIFG